MKDHTNEFDPTDIQNNKTMGILSYIGLLVLIPIFAAKDSKFARFHANQGLVLVIAQAIITTVLSITAVILGLIPYIGWFLALIVRLLIPVVYIPSIIGIINAAKGQAKELPIIGGIRILK
ncbi:MAG: hypothetical protein IIZ35_04185 [Clostridia bacterium]|nr:hypothetical protein [Clostridia bacterium]